MNETSDRFTSFALALIVLLGATVRVEQVAHGLPYLWEYDEGQRIGQTFEILQKVAEGKPHEAVPRMTYPPMYLYLCAGVIGLATAASGMAWQFSHDALRMAFWADKGPYIFMGRAVSLVWGLGVVWMVFLVAKRLFDKRTGLLAALTVALLPTAQWFSVLAVVEMQQVFFLLATLYFAAGIVDEGRMRDYVLCGLAVGFAAATKYNGIAALLAAGAAHILALKGARRDIVRGLFSPKAFAMGLAIVAAFVLGCPYVYLAPGRFLAGAESLVSLQVAARPAMGGGFWTYLVEPQYLWSMAGPALLVLCVVGLVRAGLCGRKGMLAAVFTVGLLLFASSFRCKAARNVVGAVCLLGLMAACGTAWLQSLGDRQGTWGLLWRIVLFLALAGPLLMDTIRQSFELNGPDTRLQTKGWIEACVPGGSLVVSDDLQAQLVDEADTLARMGPRFRGRAYRLLEMGHMFQFDRPLKPFREYVEMMTAPGKTHVVIDCELARPLFEAGEFFVADGARRDHFEKFYRWVMNHGEVVAAFRARPWRNRGPEMIVMRLQ